jgi:signal transduction histidine kinase
MTAASAHGLGAARILVVDDDAGGRYVKAHILAGQGYSVAEADRGYSALAQIAAAPPDLVLLDVKLPDVDGVEVCRRIKADFPQVVVLQTSSALVSAQDRAAALDCGADSYLIEPIEPDELIAIVKALLRMRQAEQELRLLNETLEARVAERAAELGEATRRLEVERANRDRAEEVLWHAQKLEAVGQLTGGVAHDFNNLLTVITASLDMLREVVAGSRKLPAERQLKLVDAAQSAADHGAQLTRQLLAFARRSVLDAKPVDLNAVISGFGDFLRRALGETISLDVAYAPDLWPCHVDRVQFEAALINLVVNARDAMPRGGELRIRTGNAETGDPGPGAPGDCAEQGRKPAAYVYVSVSDNGVGMAADVAERAFEPFFTTKAVGQGSGLGLSQVYGFVTQSGGQVTIQTAPAAGSTFTLYLPRSEGVPEAHNPAVEPAPDPGSGRETILVVEDNIELLEITVALISDLGYNVLVAADGVEALGLLRGDTPIDLLFSDVVMPHGISGVALAAEAQRINQDLEILLTSGYPELRGADHGSGGFPILAKPYRRDDLARMLGAALASRRERRAGRRLAAKSAEVAP